jgi:hypothetical protein
MTGRRMRLRTTLQPTPSAAPHESTPLRAKWRVGSAVWAKRVGPGRRPGTWEAGTIIERVGPAVVLVETVEGNRWRRHVNQIRVRRG